MKARSSRILVVMLAGLLVGLAGCTSSQQLEEAMDMARQAQSDAAAARQAASSASSAAAEAKRTADAAARAAQSAQSSADQANSCCNTNSEKIERMFRESMRK